jgi:hypothetical protein
MAKKQLQLFWGLLAVGATIYLMRDPRCKRGCKTILQHLLVDELNTLL